MPTYEYVCEKCGHQFDQVQSIAAKPLAVCPEEICNQKRWAKGRVKRAISGGGGLLFKGTGFYITDYRSENYKQAAKKDSSAPSTGETKSASGGESKTGSGETKPPSKPEAKPTKTGKTGKTGKTT